jgi:hypothetical protein
VSAINPNGDELYWVDGYAYQGVLKPAIIPYVGQELYWVDGHSEQNIVPLSTLTGSFFLMF